VGQHVGCSNEVLDGCTGKSCLVWLDAKTMIEHRRINVEGRVALGYMGYVSAAGRK